MFNRPVETLVQTCINRQASRAEMGKKASSEAKGHLDKIIRLASQGKLEFVSSFSFE